MRSAVLQMVPLAQSTSHHVVVPTKLILEMVAALKHYPTDYDLQQSGDRAPHIWGS